MERPILDAETKHSKGSMQNLFEYFHCNEENIYYEELKKVILAKLKSQPNHVDDSFQFLALASCIDRQRSPVISKLFWELATNKGAFLLSKLEKTCQEFLQVLTMLEVPSPVQFSTVFLLSSMSRLDALPQSFRTEVLGFLEEVTTALWPYCTANAKAPNLWNSENFVDALCDVLLVCGETMETCCPTNLTRTFQMVDRQIIANKVSGYSRFRLLELREWRLGNWKMEERTRKYYKTAYRKHIDSLKKRFAEMAVSADLDEAINAIGKEHIPVVLRIHETQLTLDTQQLQQNSESGSSSGDTTCIEEGKEELAADHAAKGNSCKKDDNVDVSKCFTNAQSTGRVSMSAFVKGGVAQPRKPHKSNSVLALNGQLIFDKRGLFSSDAKDPRNEEFSTRFSPEREEPPSIVQEQANVGNQGSTLSDGEQNQPNELKIPEKAERDTVEPASADTDFNWRRRSTGTFDQNSNLSSSTTTPSGTFIRQLRADADFNWRERPTDEGSRDLKSITENQSSESNTRTTKSGSLADMNSGLLERKSGAGTNDNAFTPENRAHVQSSHMRRGGFGKPAASELQRNQSYEEPKTEGLGTSRLRRCMSEGGVELGKEKSSGGFGSPRDSKTNSPESPDDTHQLEVQLDEEEVERLRGYQYRRLLDIQAAKQKVLELVSAPEEEFGTLVPLPEKMLEFLHCASDRDAFLTRLAVLSGASIKQISDDQIFLSGRRNFVNSAKTSLAKFNVMLKYSDDPDVGGGVHVEGRGLALIQELFERLELADAPVPRSGSAERSSTRITYNRSFLLNLADSPPALQRPMELSVDRQEDWTGLVVLKEASHGERTVSGTFVQCRSAPTDS